jgi:hypothetical protein
MLASLATLAEEGFNSVWRLDDAGAVDGARIERAAG